VDNNGLTATSAPVTATIAANGSGELIYYINADQLNTPRLITDSDGNTVWKWDGEAFGNTPPQAEITGTGKFTFNLRFPGQYYDAETGLHYNTYRDYDPSTGRYVESDPLGFGGGQTSTFGYVGGNPLSHIDPFGLCDCSLDPQKMADWLRKHAQKSPGGFCARYVSHAIDAAGGNSGYSTNTNPAAGKDAGQMLMNNGFYIVSADAYTPQVGDTKVFGALPGHPYGHVETYTTYTGTNGKLQGQWVSDYLQNNDPPPSYASAAYVIYRPCTCD
jgi:RHS repeat-associated protein